MVDVEIKELLAAGAHFGHKSSRWHPKMAPYIHSKRDGNHIIDLTKTVEALDIALGFITKTVAEGKQILLVGTKQQAQELVRAVAVATGMPFVVERWLGGMLTNKATIGDRVKYLKDLETKMASGMLASKYSKLEVQRYQEEIDAMNHLYGGIKELGPRLGAVFVVDIVHDHNAVSEAIKLKIPLIGLADTNSDPSLLTYPIPSNDDAIKTIKLIMSYVQQALEAGLQQSKQAKEIDEKVAEKAAKTADQPIIDSVKEV